MKEIQQNIKKLNKLLEATHFDLIQFENILNSINNRKSIKIRILDFDYYSKERLNVATKEKKDGLKNQNYEKAANFRDLEKKCQKHVEFKIEHNIEKSMFFYEQKYLLFLHMGTAKNDKIIKEYLE